MESDNPKINKQALTHKGIWQDVMHTAKSYQKQLAKGKASVETLSTLFDDLSHEPFIGEATSEQALANFDNWIDPDLGNGTWGAIRVADSEAEGEEENEIITDPAKLACYVYNIALSYIGDAIRESSKLDWSDKLTKTNTQKLIEALNKYKKEEIDYD